MADKTKQLIVNGDFATGDLHGWDVDAPAYFKVVPYEPGKNCVVQLSAPSGAATLPQTIISDPGQLYLSLWHRATDEHGNPVDKQTVSAGMLSYSIREDIHLVPVLLLSTGTWKKWTYDFMIPKGTPPTRIDLKFQNIDNSLLNALKTGLGLQAIEETPVALRDIGLWNMHG